MIIAIASGKGGTGKTSVAVNMAISIGSCRVLDCDVEEPNVHTLLNPVSTEKEPVMVLVPVVNQEKCTLCGVCSDFCEFNAIFVGKTKVILYLELCHSCGGCSIVCPENAIDEVGRQIGEVFRSKVNDIDLFYGKLNIGEPFTVPVIKSVKSKIDHTQVNILDAPPGTSCPVIETIQDCDYIILVTEPTPFGLHDLSMAVDVVKEIGIPHGVIINRSTIGDEGVKEYCRNNGIPVLLEIPYDRKIAELYSRGFPFVNEMPEYRLLFKRLFNEIKEVINRGL